MQLLRKESETPIERCATSLPVPPSLPPWAPAERVRPAEVPKLQAVGDLRREGAAGGDGVPPALPTAHILGPAGAQQQGLGMGLGRLLEEGAQLRQAEVALAAEPRARLPVGLAQAVTLVVKSTDHSEFEAEVRVCGESSATSPGWVSRGSPANP